MVLLYIKYELNSTGSVSATSSYLTSRPSRFSSDYKASEYKSSVLSSDIKPVVGSYRSRFASGNNMSTSTSSSSSYSYTRPSSLSTSTDTDTRYIFNRSLVKVKNNRSLCLHVKHRSILYIFTVKLRFYKLRGTENFRVLKIKVFNIPIKHFKPKI